MEKYAGLDFRDFNPLKFSCKCFHVSLTRSANTLLKSGTYIHKKKFVVLLKTTKIMKVYPSKSFPIYSSYSYVHMYLRMYVCMHIICSYLLCVQVNLYKMNIQHYKLLNRKYVICTYVNQLLNQGSTGCRPVRAWFLKLFCDSVSVCVFVCVCPVTINNQWR